MKPIAKWTIGNTNSNGYKCLLMSIESFLKHHQAEIYLCFNCEREKLDWIKEKLPFIHLINQKSIKSKIKPIGVAWKLYPARIDINAHELSIDNDIVFSERIQEIDNFFEGDHTLLLEGSSRNYGRFEKHVHKEFKINSGVFGMPPGFDLQKHIDFFMGEEKPMGISWEPNAHGEHEGNFTFDEQGLIATALLNNPRFTIIKEATITNCERRFIKSKGMHFIGLNKNKRHAPFIEYCLSKARINL